MKIAEVQKLEFKSDYPSLEEFPARWMSRKADS